MEKGHFTLPGEAGYEKLTLQMAERWGADVIRDSDGTQLSDEILGAGYGIYSTICPIREHNRWIHEHPEARQQTFLSTSPRTAEGSLLTLMPMEDFFSEQFEINDSDDALRYWQVYDRTANEEVPRSQWVWNAFKKQVEIQATPWRQYTVSFLAWRIWEEISMYNHVTNQWNQEHLLQLNPYRQDAQTYLRRWFQDWCANHPHTTVVRFTSLFYNFAWIWGADKRNRHLFTDWASYDFTVCPEALDDFQKEYGYALHAEDFVRQGKYNATHRVPTAGKRDWMAFIGSFVRRYARELVDIVHGAGKEAYVFYDDSWVGLEPYSGFFEEFGFDGLIKCVFSGFEARMCAGVPVKTHEIRLHPYLFPVGLCGAPTFSPGGQPGRDAMEYWVQVRRALLRQKIERVGLGGYLHLIREYPDFATAMDVILTEFRAIGRLHDEGAPMCMKPRIGILTAWGSLRSWTLSGHFHETHTHVLIHVLESLAGLPFEVSFHSFDDIKQGVPEGIDVLLNAGEAGSAWSGGALWKDNAITEALTQWTHEGGVFFGIGEASAVEGYHTALRMAHVLGVDINSGERDCHGSWAYEAHDGNGLIPAGFTPEARKGVVLFDGSTEVLLEAGDAPYATIHPFGKGKGLYLANYVYHDLSTRLLQNLLLFATGNSPGSEGVAENPLTECAVYPDAGKLALGNRSASPQKTACLWKGRRYEATLAPYAMALLELSE